MWARIEKGRRSTLSALWISHPSGGAISPANFSGVVGIVVLGIGGAIKHTLPSCGIPIILLGAKRALWLAASVELGISKVVGRDAGEVAHSLIGKGSIPVQAWGANVDANSC